MPRLLADTPARDQPGNRYAGASDGYAIDEDVRTGLREEISPSPTRCGSREPRHRVTPVPALSVEE